MQDWFKKAVGLGLSHLYMLNLESKPASTDAKTVRDVWVATLQHKRQWNMKRDAPLIAEAFAVLLRTCDRFPTPKQFLAAMPSHLHQKALPMPEVSDEQAAKNKQRISGLAIELLHKAETEKQAKKAKREENIKAQQVKIAALLEQRSVDNGGNICPRTCTVCSYYDGKRAWLTGVIADAIAASKHDDPEKIKRSAAQLRKADSVRQLVNKALRQV
jgi:hypothetical protein